MLCYQKVSCFASFEISSCICATKILLILHVLFSNGDYLICADKYQPDLTKICILEIDWFKQVFLLIHYIITLSAVHCCTFVHTQCGSVNFYYDDILVDWHFLINDISIKYQSILKIKDSLHIEWLRFLIHTLHVQFECFSKTKVHCLHYDFCLTIKRSLSFSWWPLFNRTVL